MTILNATFFRNGCCTHADLVVVRVIRLEASVLSMLRCETAYPVGLGWLQTIALERDVEVTRMLASMEALDDLCMSNSCERFYNN